MPKEQSNCVTIVGGVWDHKRTTMFVAMRCLKEAHKFATARMPSDDMVVMVANPIMCVINNLQYLIDIETTRRLSANGPRENHTQRSPETALSSEDHAVVECGPELSESDDGRTDSSRPADSGSVVQPVEHSELAPIRFGQ